MQAPGHPDTPSPFDPSSRSGGDPRSAPASLDPPPHFGPEQTSTDVEARVRFEEVELRDVLAHYDLGGLQRVTHYPRGSRRSPKALVRAAYGTYLLKRRAPGRDEAGRVRRTHAIINMLTDRGFPAARLIRTHTSGQTAVTYHGHVYELFEFIEGTSFRQSNRATQYAGHTLGRLHDLLVDERGEEALPYGSYHAAAGMLSMLRSIPDTVSYEGADVGERAFRRTCRFLETAYSEAAERVERQGWREWNEHVIHGDWHPGNLLFQGIEVAGVVDFDALRIEPRMADVANGALQFSMRYGEVEEPLRWPDGVSAHRIRAFVRGYDQGTDRRLSREEDAVLPWLMIEALVAESVVPIAATGRFARIPGAAFLTMIERKVRWLQPRADKLIEFLRS